MVEFFSVVVKEEVLFIYNIILVIIIKLIFNVVNILMLRIL